MQKAAKNPVLVAGTSWAVRDERGHAGAIDERVLPLVRAIAKTGTLTAAASAAGIPYRTAWGVLEDAGRSLGTALVVLARGRGATLTPLARRWLAVDDTARAALQGHALAIEQRERADAGAPTAKPRVRVAASHDIALAQLKGRWRVGHGVALEFQGSAASLDAYRAGLVDVAGFHVPVDDAEAAAPLVARLAPSRDALLAFLRREQGLILPRGNPRRVRTLGDLVAKRLSIVNRQPASGTRLLLDRLLTRAGIDPAAIAGHANEEFTHAAVAATIAAGRADAGFGIRAAAAQFGLAFLPLATERYLFACRRRTVDSPGITMFRALLASPATRAVVAPLPGYALDAPGEVVPFGAG